MLDLGFPFIDFVHHQGLQQSVGLGIYLLCWTPFPQNSSIPPGPQKSHCVFGFDEIVS